MNRIFSTYHPCTKPGLFLFLFIFITASGGKCLPSSLPSLTSDTVPGGKNIESNRDSVLKKIKISPDAVKSKVAYAADDSMRFDVLKQKVYLYGKGVVTYENIKLQSDYIEFDLQENLVFAKGMADSAGKEAGTPVFNDGGQEFKALNMTYNFRTKKGRVKEILTHEGDGYVHGDSIYKDPDDILFIKDGKYTTCDDVHPHFAINASKIKIIRDDKIISGPAYLEVADVPTPLFLPFGIFPLKKDRASGVLLPAPGESPEGFSLKEGGYYFGFSDYVDLTVRTDIYSNGSWGMHGLSAYRKRYRYYGNFSLDYSHLKQSEEGFPDFSLQKDFRIQWAHSQDSKTRPGTRFSANVNFASGGYLQYNSYDVDERLSNTLNSSVAWSKTIGKNSLTVNFGMTQSTTLKKVTMKLPELIFSRSSWQLFKSKMTKGKLKWYENIRTAYTFTFKNEIDIPDTVLFKRMMQKGVITNTISESYISENPGYYYTPIAWNKYLKNGMMLSVPLSTSVRFLKYFNFTPSVNTTGRGYFQSYSKKWDSVTTQVLTDTLPVFRASGDFAVTTPVSTQIFGLYEFRGEGIQAIRHVMTPSVGISWRPDFSESFWGYYKKVQSDTSGKTYSYSVFGNGIYGTPPSGKYGAVTFSLTNNLEMKVKSGRDTLHTVKKIKLFEGLTLSTYYNLAADSLNLAPVAISGRTDVISNVLNIYFRGTVDPYTLTPDSVKINTFQWEVNRKVGRLTNGNVSVNVNLKSKNKTELKPAEHGDSYFRAGYADFNIPWTLTLGYNFDYTRLAYTNYITQSISVGGEIKLTENWKINGTTYYDFISKKLTLATIDITRDMHCWELKFRWSPLGSRPTYLLDLHVKAQALQELKITKKKDYYDY